MEQVQNLIQFFRSLYSLFHSLYSCLPPTESSLLLMILPVLIGCNSKVTTPAQVFQVNRLKHLHDTFLNPLYRLHSWDRFTVIIDLYTSSHLCFLRNSRCSSCSTPSATTVKFKLWASWIMVCTLDLAIFIFC